MQAVFRESGDRVFRPQPFHRILICGAVGTAALQLAKDRAAKVTAVGAGRHPGVARSLGADLAVDYASAAFNQLGRNFALVVDADQPFARSGDGGMAIGSRSFGANRAPDLYFQFALRPSNQSGAATFHA